MGLLRKMKRKDAKPIKIKQVTGLFLKIDELKQKGLLQTTDYGVFYTFVEVLNQVNDPSPLLRNFYIYARNTNLIREGETLEIRDLYEANDDFLIANIHADQVELHQLTRKKTKADH